MRKDTVSLFFALAVVVAVIVLVYVFRITAWEVTPFMCQNMPSKNLSPAQIKRCAEMTP